MNLSDKYEKNRNVINSCYYGKTKVNHCYEFMPGDIQVICGSLVGENRRSPASTGTPEKQ